LPPMTGIMLSTIDPHLKTTANSLANLIYNLGGYLPGPFIYGVVFEWAKKACMDDKLKDDNDELVCKNEASFYSMAVLMFSPILSVVTLGIATYCIRRTDILKYS